jgi:Zn2+/Cd2+-exporting ATPase
MDKTAQRILEEIAEEREELKVSAALTLVTLVGLVGALIVGWMSGPVWLVVGLYVAAYLAGGLRATKEALIELKNGSLDINLLMVLAALAAAAVGEVRDGAILLLLFSLAGTLEGYAMGNTKRSIAALMDLRPDTARRKLADGNIEMVPVESLAVGDAIVVRPGERIATDGEIIDGAGAIDQSSVTGESVPVDKSVGDSVFAGTLNQNVVLAIRVTTPASQSTLARMITLVTEAQEKRSPSERFSDWFGQRYTIAVLLGSATALGIFILVGFPFAEAAYKAATLLVVASPCAIVISVPAAVLSALAVAARHGVLFKGGAALEDFGNVTAIALDKTGTLTVGAMEVVAVVPLVGSADELLAVARTVEEHSDHPLARSVVRYADSAHISSHREVRTETIVGKGIVTTTEEGKQYWVGNRGLATSMRAAVTDEVEAALVAEEQAGKTAIIVGVDAAVVGIIALADTPRPTALKALATLRALGVKQVRMLTGDTARVANAIGASIGLRAEEVSGDLLPEDKVAVVSELRTKHTVAFVGDGINDAAALATAHVGVAMGVAGSDVAIDAADVALLSDDLETLAYSYRLSRQTNRIIKQNLIFAVGIMVLMIIVTTFWYLPLPLGVIGHEGGTLLVVANSLRLLFMKIR